MTTSSDAGGDLGSQGKRRNRALGIGLAAVIAASGVSFAAGSRIRSPAEIAAATAPPAASLITVAVEKRTLSSDVVTRGTVRYGAPQVVTLPGSALKKGTGIVTSAAVKGTVLGEGAVALAVSGRPVFVLQGALPFYRDLGPGVSGEDVRQLEQALARLGFNPGLADGIYDGRTAGAVAAWYRKAGWTAAGPTEEQLQTLKGAQLDLLAAQEALATARVDLASAQERGRNARAAAKAASEADAAEKARSDQEIRDAAADVAAREQALAVAVQAEQAARQRLDAARSAKKPPSRSVLATLTAEAEKASKDVQDARAALTAAETVEAALKPAQVGTAAADANREAAAADADANRATAAIALAERRVALLSGGAGAATGPGVAAMRAKLGIQVPADEVLFFPTLPVRVDDVKRQTGEEATGPVMTVTNSRLVVESAVTPSDAKLVAKGAPVTITAPDLGVEATGTVSDVGATPGTNGVDPQRFFLAVAPDNVPASLVGASVVLTIKVQSTQGEVLAVPVAALSQAADGSSRVQVQEGDRTTRFVTVTPGLAAKGLVAVTPVDGNLAPGMLVVVGRAARTGG